MESNLDIARRGYEAALAGDLDAVREFLAPDVRWHGGDPDAPGACRNRDQALRFMGRAFGWPGPLRRCHPRPRESVDASLSWASSQVCLTSFGVR